MLLVLTKDNYFYQAIKSIFSLQEVIHIKNEDELKKILPDSPKVIIDTFNNNIFHSKLSLCLENLKPSVVYVLGPFLIKGLFKGTPVFFSNRNIDLIDFLLFINLRNRQHAELTTISKRHHQILTYLLVGDGIVQDSKSLGISLKTYYSHKYNVLLSLKIKRIGAIYRTKAYQYLMR